MKKSNLNTALEEGKLLNENSSDDESSRSDSTNSLYGKNGKMGSFFDDLLPECIDRFNERIAGLQEDGKDRRLLTDLKVLCCGLSDFQEARSKYWVTILDFFISELTIRLNKVESSDFLSEFPELQAHIDLAQEALEEAIILSDLLNKELEYHGIIWETMYDIDERVDN